MLRRSLLLPCLALALAPAACGSSADEEENGGGKRARPNNAAGAAGSSGATAGAAGTSTQGGAAGSPDMTGFGGSVSAGGTTGTGGASTSAGGATSSGGATSTGGSAGTGGSTSAGMGGGAGQPGGSCTGGLACTAAIPVGFHATTAPANATSAPVCAGGERLGLTAATALTCAACGCAGVAASCTPSDIKVFTGSSASSCNGVGQIIDPKGPSCGEYSVSSNSNAHAKFTLTLPAVSCTSSGGTETARPTAFATAIDVCPTTGASGGCPGALCAAPSAPLCIVSDGDVPCPTGWSASRMLGYRSATDTRACAPCGCDAQGSCPSSTIAVLQTPGCEGDFGPFFRFASNTCSALPLPADGTKQQHMQLDPSPATVTCTAKGGGATGTVALAQPATVCCR